MTASILFTPPRVIVKLPRFRLRPESCAFTIQIKIMSTANSYGKQGEFFINWISSPVSHSLEERWPYSQKHCPKTNIILFTPIGLHLLEVLCDGP
jgi:hypothetical protein